MDSKLVRFKDGIEVEVLTVPGEASSISSATAEKLEKNFDSVSATLQNICTPFKNTFAVLSAAGGDSQFTKAEVELSLSFTAEGDLFITKAKANAGLKIKLTLERSNGTKSPTDAKQTSTG